MLRENSIIRQFLLKISVVVLLLAPPFISIAETNGLPYYILLDMNTGNVIKENYPDHPFNPASLTKLMTAYIVFSLLKQKMITLTTPIVISKNAATQPPSKSTLMQGSIVTLDNALKLLLVKSANDIAVAIAESLCTTELRFVEQMNYTANKIGLYSTNYMNSHGANQYGHYTTARDIAILSWKIKNNFPEYSHYFNIKGIKINNNNYYNTNWAIGVYPGADGMKTGFTCASGFNIVISVCQNEKSVLAVVMGAIDREIRNNVSKQLISTGLSSRINSKKPNRVFKNSYKQNLSNEVIDTSNKVCIAKNDYANYKTRIIEDLEKEKYSETLDIITLLNDTKITNDKN